MTPNQAEAERVARQIAYKCCAEFSTKNVRKDGKDDEIINHVTTALLAAKEEGRQGRKCLHHAESVTCEAFQAQLAQLRSNVLLHTKPSPSELLVNNREGTNWPHNSKPAPSENAKEIARDIFNDWVTDGTHAELEDAIATALQAERNRVGEEVRPVSEALAEAARKITVLQEQIDEAAKVIETALPFLAESGSYQAHYAAADWLAKHKPV